jgi:hypothetical protein
MSDYGIQLKGTSPLLKGRPKPLSSQSPHLSVYREGGDVEKRRKFGPKDSYGPKPKVAEDWAAEGGRIGFKKGGDTNWIQKATASIKKRGTKGKCTPITKPGCTGRAKALAKTFKKMAKKRKNA